MRIDVDDVRRIAHLARLRLREEEVAAFRDELTAILDHVERLAEADVTGIEPSAHPRGGAQPLREDEPADSLPAERATANAPDAARGHFRVPKVLPG